MASPIIIPKQGNSVEEVILQSWHKNVGDAVAEGDVLCEVETDKAVMEVTSTASGVLLAQFFQPDDEIPVLETVAAVGEAGEDASSLAPGGAGAAPAAPAESTTAPPPHQLPKPLCCRSSTSCRRYRRRFACAVAAAQAAGARLLALVQMASSLNATLLLPGERTENQPSCSRCLGSQPTLSPQPVALARWPRPG